MRRSVEWTLDQRKSPLATADEYVIDKLWRLRQTSDSYSAKVRWFDYASKNDTWEPPENLLRSLVVRFLRQKKKHVPGYEWQTPTRRSRRQAGLTTVANRHGLHVDTHCPTCPCYQGRSYPGRCLVDRFKYSRRN